MKFSARASHGRAKSTRDLSAISFARRNEEHHEEENEEAVEEYERGKEDGKMSEDARAKERVRENRRGGTK